MLSELQKNNLSKLLQDHNFEYLRPPPEVHEINYSQTQQYQITKGNDKNRRIFYRVKYDLEEERAIFQTKKELKKLGIKQKLNDELILKHVYGGKWDMDKVLDRLQKVIEYHTSEKYTRLNKQILSKLEQGFIYTYGHDRNFRPTVIMKLGKFDPSLELEQHFNVMYYLMLVVQAYRMVPYHAQKFNMIMDFQDVTFSKIPFRYIFSAFEKLNTYYCNSCEKTFIYNAQGFSSIWSALSFFIPESQKQRIIFINEGEETKILEQIDEYELEKKYGGKLANLNEFWPPKNTNESFDLKMNNTLTDSEFLSVQNDFEYFQIAVQGEEKGINCGSQNCSCDIY